MSTLLHTGAILTLVMFVAFFTARILFDHNVPSNSRLSSTVRFKYVPESTFQSPEFELQSIVSGTFSGSRAAKTTDVVEYEGVFYLLF